MEGPVCVGLVQGVCMADAYESTLKGTLKIKGVQNHAIKKKKKKSKMKVKDLPLETFESQTMKPASKPVDKRTAAQKAYDKIKERRQADKVLKKVEKTHRERVREFNQHLDTLTEHFDIQKVSWTK